MLAPRIAGMISDSPFYRAAESEKVNPRMEQGIKA
jgi:hypothetical protein